MSISQRTQRVHVFAHTDIGSPGRVVDAYALVPSVKPDRAWWAARSAPTGRERVVGEQGDRQVDAVFVVDAAVPVTSDGLVRCGGQYFVVVAVLPRDNGGRELQVYAERADGNAYTITGEGS